MNADDLLTLADAARVCERSTSTVRRWIKRGELPATIGQPPKDGGRAPYLIRAGDLMQHIADTGIQPQQSAKVHKTPEPTAAPTVTTATEDRSEELAALRFEVERVKLEAQADTARLRLAHALEQVNAAQREAHQAREEAARLRAERDDWRERHDARMAELEAMRKAHGLPWWRKLLGGPVAELPDLEN